MRLTNSKTFYIKTEYAQGSPWDFTVKIPDTYLRAHETEALRISLLSWNLFCDWDNVTVSRNELSINGESITIPVGNYTYRQLANVLTELYASTNNQTTMLCEYLPTFNRLRFTFSASSSITFSGDSAGLLGFIDNTVSGTVIESETSMKPRVADKLTIGLRDVILRSHAFENDSSGDLRPVTHLVSVPITSPPYGLNVWRSEVDGDASLFVADKVIKSLRFIIYTDDSTQLATFIPHSSLVVRVDTFIVDETREMIDHLQKISEYTRLNFVQQGLSQTE